MQDDMPERVLAQARRKDDDGRRRFSPVGALCSLTLKEEEENRGRKRGRWREGNPREALRHLYRRGRRSRGCRRGHVLLPLLLLP